MSRYKAYPEYKESGVEMLGPLPASWATMQVRYLLRDGGEGIKIGPFGSALRLEDMVDSGVRVYGQENVIQRDFSLGTRRISAEKFSEMAVYEVSCGDVLITMMGTSGKCILVPEEAEKGIIDSHLLRIRLNDKDIIPAFFRLMIDESFEIENQIKISGKGSIMHGLNSGIVKSLRLPLPSIPEQISILNFLDQETAKIDALIEKQQRLIELLKEKRQAVISHAVTKGINPNAPMKDSGVEWLGEVPVHWSLKKISHIGRVLNGSTPDKSKFSFWNEGSIPWLASSCLNSPTVDEPTELISAQAFERSSLELIPAGSLLVGMVGQGKTRGTSAVLTIESCINQNMAAIIPNKHVNINFLYYLFQAMYHDLRELGRGGNQAALNCEIVASIRVPIPAIEEQQCIVSFISKQLAVMILATDSADQQIKLLHERRSALISAAVTGKIDVRDWQAAA